MGSSNTLSTGHLYPGESQEDLDLLLKARGEFVAMQMPIHVHWATNGAGKECWRCGVVATRMIRPTFGDTRREAVELMIAKVVALRLEGKSSEGTVREQLKQSFSG